MPEAVGQQHCMLCVLLHAASPARHVCTVTGLQVGRETFRVCRELLDGVVLVNNAAISGAIRDVYSETRTVLEPAGALAVAGARAYLQRHHIKVRRALSAPLRLVGTCHAKI